MNLANSRMLAIFWKYKNILRPKFAIWMTSLWTFLRFMHSYRDFNMNKFNSIEKSKWLY